MATDALTQNKGRWRTLVNAVMATDAFLSAGNAAVSLNQSSNSSAFSPWYWHLYDKCLRYVLSFHIAALWTHCSNVNTVQKCEHSAAMWTQCHMSKSCNSNTSKRLQLFCRFPVWVCVWSFTIVKNRNWAVFKSRLLREILRRKEEEEGYTSKTEKFRN